MKEKNRYSFPQTPKQGECQMRDCVSAERRKKYEV